MAHRRSAAWCGILSGLGLAVEAALFMGSGWSAEAFSTVEGAAAATAGGGQLLRWAAVAGVVNLALLTVFLAGLAQHLGGERPALRSGILHLGLIGIAIHAIVPIGFYHAVPALAALAADPAGAPVWTSWTFILDVAQGAGVFFMGLAMLTAGIGWISRRHRSLWLAAVGGLAGGASVIAALGPGAAVAPLLGLLAIAGLLLSILFRLLGGLHLLRAGA